MPDSVPHSRIVLVQIKRSERSRKGEKKRRGSGEKHKLPKEQKGRKSGLLEYKLKKMLDEGRKKKGNA